MPGITIKPQVLAELQRQISYELGASHAYLALAIWCETQNLKGFARFFSTQVVEERKHAQKLIEHVLDRGALPVLEALVAPQSGFSTLLDVAEHAQSMEQQNTTGINACYAAAMLKEDYPAQVLLQWFITEQVEEEKWADEMVDRVKRAICAGAVGDLDRHISRYLTEEGVDAAKCASP